MDSPRKLPVWSPRVKQKLIRELYENDAQGFIDEELINEVGWALRARCESFVAAVGAMRGRVTCPACGAIILHHRQADEILHCPQCDWELPWKDYFATIQHKQLSGADPVMAFFQDFVDRFPKAREPQEKMVLIDTLIHGWHLNMIRDIPLETRAAGVNLIEGNYHEVVEFLDGLSSGEASTTGVREKRQEWRAKLAYTAEMWNDPRLRRKSNI